MIDDATREAYQGIEVRLPSGEVRVVPSIPLTEGIRLLALSSKAEAGDGAATLECLEFIDKMEALEGVHLTPAEAFEVLRDFLSFRRTGVGVVRSPQSVTEPSSSTPRPST